MMINRKPAQKTNNLFFPISIQFFQIWMPDLNDWRNPLLLHLLFNLHPLSLPHITSLVDSIVLAYTSFSDLKRCPHDLAGLLVTTFRKFPSKSWLTGNEYLFFELILRIWVNIFLFKSFSFSHLSYCFLSNINSVLIWWQIQRHWSWLKVCSLLYSCIWVRIKRKRRFHCLDALFVDSN